MRAVVLDQAGGPEVLRLTEVTDLKPAGDEVLIDIAFCGCNWADTQVRAGIYPHPLTYPLILGFEVSGTVAAVGPDVREVQPGQRVCAIVEKGGGYAEQVLTREINIMPVPDAMALDTAAAFPIQALTAYHMLHSVHDLKEGALVLCHAVGGGVGLHVTQLASRWGAQVIGTVGTKGKEALPLRYGAKRVINSREEDFVEAVMDFSGGAGVHLAIDSLGATTLDRTFGVMRNLGHVINIGEAEGNPFHNLRERLLPKSLTFTRFHLQHVGPGSHLWKEGQRYVMQAITDGWLEVPVVEVYPLSEAADMHRRLEGRGVSGKLLISPHV